MQTLSRGFCIEAIEAICIAVFDRKRKRTGQWVLPKKPVTREPVKPYRYDATRDSIEHAKIHLFLICS